MKHNYGKLLQEFCLQFLAIHRGEAACIHSVSQGTSDVHLLQGKMHFSWVLRVSRCLTAGFIDTVLLLDVNSWHPSLDCLVPSSWFVLLIKLLSYSLSPKKESNEGQGHHASILGYMCVNC